MILQIGINIAQRAEQNVIPQREFLRRARSAGTDDIKVIASNPEAVSRAPAPSRDDYERAGSTVPAVFIGHLTPATGAAV
jgi:hypothetical protein